jgi:hypothetical protein
MVFSFMSESAAVVWFWAEIHCEGIAMDSPLPRDGYATLSFWHASLPGIENGLMLFRPINSPNFW